MRIRSIKPEFWRSDDVDALDWHTRLLFIGLWSYVDDNGVGRDRVSDIVADLFAGDLSGDPPETLRRVSEGLEALSRGGQIVRYVADGRALLFVVGWDRHQQISHPNKERYRRPTREDATIREPLPNSSGESPETLPTGAGEQGNRGTEEKNPHKPPRKAADPAKRQRIEDAFNEFWKLYPKKINKRTSHAKWGTAAKTTDPQVMLDGLTRYIEWWARKRTETQFIPHPDVWINRRKWEDELDTGNGHEPAVLPEHEPDPFNAWMFE